MRHTTTSLSLSLALGCLSANVLTAGQGQVDTNLLNRLVHESKSSSRLIDTKAVASKSEIAATTSSVTMPPPVPIDDPYIPIDYNYEIDGYAVKGTVAGNVCSAYSNGTRMAIATVQWNQIPVQLAGYDQFGTIPLGWQYVSSYSYYFQNLPYVPGIANLKFVYHHGYNTITEWWSSSKVGSFSGYAFIINHLGPVSHNEGGFDYQTVLTNASNIPVDPGQPGTTFVTSKGTSAADFMGSGSSNLASVEVWTAVPGSSTYNTIQYDVFVPWDRISNNKLMVQIPGIGLAKYGNHLEAGSITAPSPSVVKLTRTYTATAILTCDEFYDNFGGSYALAAQALHDAASNRAPAPTPTSPVGGNLKASACFQQVSMVEPLTPVSEVSEASFLNFQVSAN